MKNKEDEVEEKKKDEVKKKSNIDRLFGGEPTAKREYRAPWRI